VKDRTKLFFLLLAVLAVRLAYLGLFHDRIFSGPSTQFEQAFVAMGLLEGKGVSVYREPPAVIDPSDSDRLLDPERYSIADPARVPYIKEVPGYGFFLAALWKIAGTKTWLVVQLFQIALELLAAWGLYGLAGRFFGPRAAFGTVLVFAFLFHEARVSVIAYKDIFLLYGMLIIAFLAARILEGRGRAVPTFALVCAATGLGYYFMPNILLYPFFLIATLLVLKKIKFRAAIAFTLLAIALVGAAILPYQIQVRAHRFEPGVTPPLFWYRFWLGTQVRSFYSTEEERFQDFFRQRMQATGRTLEEICKDEFLADLKAHPGAYVAKTAGKLPFGTVLVYGNAGDASYATSWSRFKTDHPQSGFKDYARSNPLRILGMILGTLSASLLFPLSIAAAVLLIRSKKSALALFFLHIPLYYILLHMFFHYEARYLLGTLPGYLPLIGYLISRIGRKRAKRAAAQPTNTLPA
jgi:4-amino-4-deoxy-L-arabinose transferase-like glycosyltransferase